MYLNLKGNKTPFAALPLNRDTDSLRYVREYLVNRVLSKSNLNISFTFLSKQGVRIHLSQENEILAMSQVVTRKIKRKEWHHMFIVVNMIPRRRMLVGRKRHRDDEDDDDDEDEEGNDEEERLTKRFHQAPSSIQSRLALEYIQNASSSSEDGSITGSGAFQHDNNSLLIVATSRNMTQVVRDSFESQFRIYPHTHTHTHTSQHRYDHYFEWEQT